MYIQGKGDIHTYVCMHHMSHSLGVWTLPALHRTLPQHSLRVPFGVRLYVYDRWTLSQCNAVPPVQHATRVTHWCKPWHIGCYPAWHCGLGWTCQLSRVVGLDGCSPVKDKGCGYIADNYIYIYYNYNMMHYSILQYILCIIPFSSSKGYNVFW